MNAFLSLFHDPRHRQLVEKLIKKTEAGTLPWTRTPTSYETVLRNGTHIGFVVSSNPFLLALGSGQGWAQFSVRQRDGTEIIKIEAPGPFLTAALDPLRSAIDMLFSMVSQKGTDKLDEVLGELDQT